MSRLPLLVFLVTVSACGGQGPSAPAGEHDPRFVGEWIVDQPAHALYEATRYGFEADGTLVVLDSCSLSFPDDYVTGTVQNDLGNVICKLGASWRSDGPDTLIVDGDCDDGMAREIVLDVSTQVAKVVSVGGDPAWDHYGFDWRWLECKPLPYCDPYWC